MTSSARVSLVVTCFNQAHFLHEALASLRAQRYPAFEIIVVDDGSTDNTEAVATSCAGVRYVRQGNRGLAGARNTGISLARGDYVVFLDADDRLMPDAIHTGLREFATHPDCAFVAGNHRMMGFDGTLLWEHAVGPEDDDLYCALLRRNFIAMHAAVMYQRFAFEVVGGFDDRPRSTEDYDMYLRLARRFPVWWHHEVVAEYRRHGSNMTRDAGRVLQSALLTLECQRGLSGRARRARRAGIHFIREYYGQQLTKELAARMDMREWRTAATSALMLLRHHPRGLWSALAY